jgi:hypothetical protein
MGAVAAVTAVLSLAYSVQTNDSAQRRYGHAQDTANAQAAAEVAERNRVVAERTQQLTAEAERERALAISYQDAQNVRVTALAAEAAANEKAIAQNISERSQEEALIVKQDAARETARIEDLKATTQGRQIAALASGGVGEESGTSKALLLDTATRANKDIGAVKEASSSKQNLLTKQAAFAVEQGDVSSKNILESASHATKTNAENVKNAADTLVANAKITGAGDLNMAGLQNLMTLGSAAQFSQQVDRLRSEANARMWGSILGSNLFSPTNLNTLGFGNNAPVSAPLSLT